ncbi:hypothetical protein [Ruminococcus sp.]|uniref:hypothetical protein n=1 Tax=Ruminococcus sp. TaxID=41978 RepID=UPI002C7C9954|nr:hypothetical protein [Ruminococcus sp.]HNZ99787.1 hypothetical protein [Ruminococcus sp.]HOH85853.1 hypothetical protein [Ruminococcus sp.]
MKLLKRVIIWFAFLTGIFFIVNAVGSLFVDKLLVNRMTDSMKGYSSKVDQMIHPLYKEPEEEGKSNGLSGLTVRCLLDNSTLDLKENFISTFVFTNVQMDQSVIMFDENGMSRLSDGIFALVYEDNDLGADKFKSAVGVIDVSELIKAGEAGKIFSIMETIDDIQLRLDSYTVDENYIVSPAKITVLHEGGQMIESFDFPVSGEVINSDNTYIDHDNEDKIHSGFSLYLKIKDAKRGERKSDRAARQLADKVVFSGGDQNDYDKSYGIGVINSKLSEVRDGKAMVTVLRFRFLRCVFADTAILGAIMTLIMVLVCRYKDKNERAGYGYQNSFNNYRR